MTYRVVLTAQAEEDLVRLFDFVIERDLAREGGDLELPQRALDANRDGPQVAREVPFTCRKVGSSPFLRELLIPFGHTGYVALIEVVDQTAVAVGAIRHRREEDYY